MPIFTKEQISVGIFILLGIMIGSLVMYFDKKNPKFHNFLHSYFKKNETGYIKVQISGCVKKPGVYRLKYKSKFKDLIHLAGGYTEFAMPLCNENLTLTDGKEYFVPIRKLEKNEPKINLNTANLIQLQQIPYVTEDLAKKIISYREKYGRFDEIEELMEIEGINENKYDEMRNFVEVK